MPSSVPCRDCNSHARYKQALSARSEGTNPEYLGSTERVESVAELNTHRPFFASCFLLGGVSLLLGWGQTAPVPSTASDSTPQRVQAGLLSTVRATKAKANDPITAQTVTPLTLKDGTFIPAGSTLLDQSDSADQQIAVTFDVVELKKKAKVPLNISVVSAMASAPGGASGNKLVAPSEGRLPNDHALNGHAYSIDTPSLVNDATQGHSGISNAQTNGVPGSTAAHTESVIGLPGFTLQIDDGPAAVSTVVPAKRNLQLDSGLH
jgi:hypothetical protein